MALQKIAGTTERLLLVAFLAAVLGLAISTALAQVQSQDEKVPPERVLACQRAADALVMTVRMKRLTMAVRDRLDTLAASLEVQCAVGRFSEAAKTADLIRAGLEKR